MPAASEAGIPNDPKALYKALTELRVEGAQVFSVHDIVLRRSAFDISLVEGKLAFLTPIGNRITGAVFSGRGHIIATPRDAGERRSLAEFLGVPLLDQPFSRAYFRFTDDTAEELERRLAAAAIVPHADEEFAGTWNSTVSNMNASHALRIMFDLLSGEPQPYFSASLGGASVGPFDVVVDRRRAEPILIGQERIGGGVERYDVWASFATSDVPAAPDSVIPVDYRIDTTIADDVSLEGHTHVHLRMQRDGERMLALELSRALSVESVSEEDGTPLVYFQNNDLSRQEIARRGNDAVFVVLPAAPAAQADVRLEIRYRGSVISDAGNGVYFVGERGSWYPHVSGGDHFVPFDLTFRWPRKLSLVATGHETEEHEDGGRRIGHWSTPQPIAVAGFNLGEYQKESAGAGRPAIELYANHQLDEWILARLRLRTVPGPDERGRSAEGVPTIDPLQAASEAGIPPKPSSVLKHLGAQVLDSIHYFENINGPFPFDELDISPIPGNFGQGWPGLIYLSTLAYIPRETQEEAGITERTQDEIANLLPYHEIVHQWWGNEVGTASYRDSWIHEAIANYLALMYTDSKKPSAHLLTRWLNTYRNKLLEPVPGSDETVADAGPLTLGYRLSSSKTPEAYDRILYGKGTWVIHMLRTMLRDPASKTPDARFEEVLRSVLEEHRYQAVSTDDIKHAFEKRMTAAMDLDGNHRLDWFFEEWVRDAGIPHYSVQFQSRPRGQGFVITGKLKQDDVPDYFTEAVPLYATSPGGKPVLLGTVATAGPETPFHFESRVRASRLLIDPQETILCKTQQLSR
ncbi:MAG: M1 family aminopeptidase [Candidatus Acidiferrales bacterium]